MVSVKDMIIDGVRGGKSRREHVFRLLNPRVVVWYVATVKYDTCLGRQVKGSCYYAGSYRSAGFSAELS